MDYVLLCELWDYVNTCKHFLRNMFIYIHMYIYEDFKSTCQFKCRKLLITMFTFCHLICTVDLPLKQTQTPKGTVSQEFCTCFSSTSFGRFLDLFEVLQIYPTSKSSCQCSNQECKYEAHVMKELYSQIDCFWMLVLTKDLVTWAEVGRKPRMTPRSPECN